jgi:hypothetical protein
LLETAMKFPVPMMCGFSIETNYSVNQKKGRDCIFATYDFLMYRVPYEVLGNPPRCAWRV